MAFDRWTKKPGVPVMLRVAAAAPLLLAPVACDSDEGETSSSSTDQFPTAGECSHGGVNCGSTGETTDPGSTTEPGTTTNPSSTTDDFPTAGECSHGGIGCGTSTGPVPDTDTDTDTDTDGSSGTGSSSGSGSTGGSSSTSG